MSNCRECRYYNDVTGFCYEMDKEVVNADAGFCIAHETSEAYDLGYDKGFDDGYNKACSNFELEYYQGHTLGEAYEEGVSDTQKFVEKRCVELGIDYTLIFTCNSVD